MDGSDINITASPTIVDPTDGSIITNSVGALATLQVVANKAALVVVIIIFVAGIFLLYRFFRTKRRKSKSTSSRYRKLKKTEDQDTAEDEDNEITVYEKTN